MVLTRDSKGRFTNNSSMNNHEDDGKNSSISGPPKASSVQPKPNDGMEIVENAVTELDEGKADANDLLIREMRTMFENFERNQDERIASLHADLQKLEADQNKRMEEFGNELRSEMNGKFEMFEARLAGNVENVRVEEFLGDHSGMNMELFGGESGGNEGFNNEKNVAEGQGKSEIEPPKTMETGGNEFIDSLTKLIMGIEKRTSELVSMNQGQNFAQISSCIKELHGNEDRGQLLKYFTHFELLTDGWTDQKRAQLLATHLVGHAQLIIDSLPGNEKKLYSKIKNAILKSHGGSNAIRFAAQMKLQQGIMPEFNEDFREFGSKLLGLVRESMLSSVPESAIEDWAKSHFLNGIKNLHIRNTLSLMSENTKFQALVDKAEELRQFSLIHSYAQDNNRWRNTNYQREVHFADGNVTAILEKSGKKGSRNVMDGKDFEQRPFVGTNLVMMIGDPEMLKNGFKPIHSIGIGLENKLFDFSHFGCPLSLGHLNLWDRSGSHLSRIDSSIHWSSNSHENALSGWRLEPRKWKEKEEGSAALTKKISRVESASQGGGMFVTFTGNPTWPEIVSSLQNNQEYMHRADIVCQIFMDKLKELIIDLTQRHILGKVAGWCYSVEHQKRGMPHVHMLLILDKRFGILTPKDVDEYICARVPYLPKMEDNSLEANQQRRYWYSVTQNMLHNCNAACLDDRRKCSKNFPKPFTDQTILSAVTYTNYVRKVPASASGSNTTASALGPDNDEERSIYYKRLAPSKEQQIDYEKEGLRFLKIRRSRVAQVLDDSRVVPHNPYLLLKYGCHINVEYVFGQKACKYIFKYILKGFEKAYVKVEQPGADPNIMDYDEIAATFKVRYMTALEAYMRISSNKIVNMSHNIYTLTVHEEKGQTIVIEEGHEQDDSNLDKIEKDTMLTGFFKLCQHDDYAQQFRYDELPYFYTWNKNTRMWTRRKYPIPTDPQKTRMFVRMYTVSPKRKELFAIRALLLFRPGPKSYADLRTINGVEYATFQEAANAANLLESDEIYIKSMEDACAQIKNLRRLQHYFALLLFHCIPSDSQALFNRFLDEMNPIPPLQHPSMEAAAKKKQKDEVMCNLEYFFRTLNTSCSEMGLEGLPSDYDHYARGNDLEDENLLDDFFGNADRKKTTPGQFALSQIARLNDDQKNVFNEIAGSLNGEIKQKLFFIEGAGGCGKTFLYNTLLRWVLSGKPNPQKSASASGLNELKKSSVISCATTGIAALLLLGGGTVHRLFRIPNNVDSKTKPRMKAQSADADRIRNTELIIIDEVSMLHRDVLNYLDILLKDICSTNQPFGGKTIIIGGDWKQLTPVVPRGNRHDQVAASIKKDPLFNEFKTLRLTKNMRAAKDQIKLCEWLIEVGNGHNDAASAFGFRKSNKDNLLRIPNENQASSLEEIVDFCFPADVFTHPFKNTNAICDNALLCPRNDDVEQINNVAMQRLAGKEHTFMSIDSPLDSGDPQDHFSLHRADFNLEAVHNETPTGLPPHALTIKLGAPVMLIKNIDVAQGLCNGIRLQVVGMNENNLHCKILTGPKANTDVFLPKVKFEYGNQTGERGLRFRRLQFPVRPCFAMTVNKAQGQTLKRVGLVLHRNQCFSHGQIYVAMSRVTEMGGIRVFSPEYDGNVVNIVYHELLDEPTRILDDDEQIYEEPILHDDDDDEY